MYGTSGTEAISQTQINRTTRSRRKELVRFMELFQEQISNIYWNEKVLAHTIPLLIPKATSITLALMLTSLQEETNKQVANLEMIFKEIGKDPSSFQSFLMDGFLENTLISLETINDKSAHDALIIDAIQMVGIYEGTAFDNLNETASKMGLKGIFHYSTNPKYHEPT